ASFCTNEQFIAAWKETGGSLGAIKERFGFASAGVVRNRRKKIEQQLGITLHSASVHSARNAVLTRKNSRRLELKLQDGVILIGSDAHVWPGPLTTAQRAFIEFSKRLKPDVIVL